MTIVDVTLMPALGGRDGDDQTELGDTVEAMLDRGFLRNPLVKVF